MKRIDSESSVALAIKAFFSKDPAWANFEFAAKAVLVKTSFVKEGPIWLIEAAEGKNKVVFVWETVTKYAYPCPGDFRYEKVEDGGEIKTDTLHGHVIKHNDELAIVWG